MMITREMLATLGVSAANITKYLDILNVSMIKYNISSKLQAANYLAQLLHESGNFQYSEELASGAAYEGRLDLGNTVVGDGRRFKGRGLIQLTGRANYKAYQAYTGVNAVANPEQLNQSYYSADVAAVFWCVLKKDKNGNSLNDMATNDQFIRITYFINGGFNGLNDRFNKLIKSYKMLEVDNIPGRIRKIYDELLLAINTRATDRTNTQKAIVREIPLITELNKMIPSSLMQAQGVPGKVSASLLKVGSPEKEDIKLLQAALGLSPDGNFGTGTKGAVVAFQMNHGMTADGIAGQKTLEALGLK